MNKIVRTKIYESPDTLNYKGEFLDFDVDGAYPFGYEDGKLIVGKEHSTHDEMPRKKEPEDERVRSYYDYSGRIFTDQKVLTFWTFPDNANHLRQICRDLEKTLNLKILDQRIWKIEVSKKELVNGKRKLIRKIIPIDSYNAPGEWSEEEKAVQHIMSPLDKMKQPKDSGPVKYHKNKTPYMWRQAHVIGDNKNEIVRPSLNENPNVIIKPEFWLKKKDSPSYTPPEAGIIGYSYPGNIPFGYYGKEHRILIISNNSKHTHYDLWKKAGRTLRSMKPEIFKNTENPTLYDMMKIMGGEREDISGRLFPSKKVITFWVFPKDYNELMDVVKDINSYLKDFKVDDTWIVEIPDGEFKKHIESKEGGWGSWSIRAGHQKYIPITDYKGGHKRSSQELAQQHVESPMTKQKIEVPTGIGSKKKTWPKHMKPFESFYPRLK